MGASRVRFGTKSGRSLSLPVWVKTGPGVQRSYVSFRRVRTWPEFSRRSPAVGNLSRSIRLLAACEKHKLEGVVSKRADTPYRSGPTTNWIKVKCTAGAKRTGSGMNSLRENNF